MHRRDFAALLLSVLALHLALRRDAGFLGIFSSSSSSAAASSPLSLRKAWYHATPPDVSASLDGTRYVPPQPLVVSIDKRKQREGEKKGKKPRSFVRSRTDSPSISLPEKKKKKI